MDLKDLIEKKIKRELKEHDLMDLLNIIGAVLESFDQHEAIHQIVYQMQKLEGFKK